jgi:hypothetical protein
VSAVFMVVRHAAQLDAQGNPVKGADGRLVKGEVLGFNAMEKRNGWGSDYPDTLRNGEWEYRAFTADKKPNESVKLTACLRQTQGGGSVKGEKGPGAGLGLPGRDDDVWPQFGPPKTFPNTSPGP